VIEMEKGQNEEEGARLRGFWHFIRDPAIFTR
jgi:hypothetical protein